VAPLVLNPNTSAAVTERLRAAVEPLVGAPRRVATAPFGAPYIHDEASFAVAGHAALDAWAADAAAHGPAAATLLGCFGDPGIEALREVSGRPVVGLAEASLREAAAVGRFAIVTGGARWRPILERLVRVLALEGALVRIETVAATGAELAADPRAAVAVLGDACRAASAGADAVVLGGAGLAGFARLLAGRVEPPLIDSVEAAARALRAAVDAAPDAGFRRTMG
jgi:allantoin racemase